ncbi:MAG: hypothetical protein U1C33_04700 [Candidatus Cloacimonadaceae bacterium]|nr:hypothetical protein [Candidatus Cloacimonadaceae bacterium]
MLLGLVACAPRLVIQPSLPNVILSSEGNTNHTPRPSAPANADAHFVQPDDYFLLNNPLEGESWVYTTMAKMMQAPSQSTDNQGQFLRLTTGETVWSRDWVKTRIATRADLSLGKKVVFLDLTNNQGVYRSPLSNQEARSNYWLHSRIVDTSELFKGYVMVGDGLKVNEKAIRIVE